MWRRIRGVSRLLLDTILPRHCYSCGQGIGDDAALHFCAACWQLIRLIQPPYCACCGQPFRSPVALAYSPEHRCGACRHRLPPFDHARAIARYEGPLRQAIHLLKYRGKLHLRQPLLQLALAHFGEHFAGTVFDGILPVPLHRQRLMHREFNQAQVLGHGLARHLGVPLLERLLVRVRWTQPQVELSGEERRQNMKNAFAVTNPAAIVDKVVLVVDDVLTTGATVAEAARVLKAAGAKQVDVFALARVVRD